MINLSDRALSIDEQSVLWKEETLQLSSKQILKDQVKVNIESEIRRLPEEKAEMYEQRFLVYYVQSTTEKVFDKQGDKNIQRTKPTIR